MRANLCCLRESFPAVKNPRPLEKNSFLRYDFPKHILRKILKERDGRLKAIRKLIKSNRIESQDSLLKLLNDEGFEVTQATLSRDLKLLKVGKIADGHGVYAYTLPTEEERQESEHIFVQDFLRGYISIETSGNIAVIKTFPGHASPVCNALDSMNFDEVLGTVAGENCLFACLREGVSGDDFLRRLKKRIPELQE